MKKIAIASALLAAISIPTVQAGVIWDFNYKDVATGFNDATFGSARQTALESAGNYVSSFLTDYNATIYMDVDGATSGGGTLAAAGSNFSGSFSDYGTGFNLRGDVMNKILNGDAADYDTVKADGEVTWNFVDWQWELGTDFQVGEFDFFSTAVHELAHAMGFSSGINQDGTDGFGSLLGSEGVWTPFDKYLTDFDGKALIDPSTSILDGILWNTSSVSQDGDGASGCDAGIQFDGANAVAANGGESAQIYTPTTWSDGSSGSHLDDDCYTSTYFMEAAADPGFGIREFSSLEIGMLKDIGYTNFGQKIAATVPEPTTAILMFGAVFVFSASKRKNKIY